MWVEDKDIPLIEHPNDAIVRVTLAAICGSDLHLYHGMVPDTRVGTTFGHEFVDVEARAGHWMMLLVADRVDVMESVVASWLALRPDNPLTKTGVRDELTHHGLRSRLGRGRADLVHQPLDALAVAAPWGLTAGAVWVGARALARRRRARPSLSQPDG